MKKPDTIIIGGGVIGMACAHYLSHDGYKVLVMDRASAGSGASHGNCGLLYFTDIIPLCSPGAVSQELLRTLCHTSPLYIKPEYDLKRILWLIRFAMQCTHARRSASAANKLELLDYSAGLFSTLFSLNTIDCSYESRGILSVFKSKSAWEAFQTTNDFLKRYIKGYTPLSRDEALDLEPALRDDIAGAWHNTSDQHLRPDRLMKSWKSSLQSKGVDFIENCRVRDITLTGRRIASLSTDKGEYSADTFVLATGAWAPLLGEKLGLSIPVEPGKGYSITMARPDIPPSIPCMLAERNMVVTPWEDGYRLGGTMEFSGYDMGLTRNRLEKLKTGAKEYMKSPLGLPLVEEWTSLRPMTFDDMPIIGRSPKQKNLVVATGHGMLGLTLATGTGKIVSDLVQERQPEIYTAPYALTRF